RRAGSSSRRRGRPRPWAATPPSTARPSTCPARVTAPSPRSARRRPRPAALGGSWSRPASWWTTRTAPWWTCRPATRPLRAAGTPRWRPCSRGCAACSPGAAAPRSWCPATARSPASSSACPRPRSPPGPPSPTEPGSGVVAVYEAVLHAGFALEAGDLVVHDQHGIGKFVEMVERQVRGGDGSSRREYVVIEYAPGKRGAAGDRLYVPMESLGQLSRYVGGEAPSLSKMGGADWQNTKRKARKAVREIATELVQLYAKRQSAPGR